MGLEERVKKLERDYEHLLRVMATQRENIGLAFGQVQTALLEQELTVRSHLGNVQVLLSDVAETLDAHELRLSTLEKREPPAA